MEFFIFKLLLWKLKIISQIWLKISFYFQCVRNSKRKVTKLAQKVIRNLFYTHLAS